MPLNLQNELEEAVLYAYFAVRYYDEHIFKIILTRTNRFASDQELQVVLGKERSFNTLTQDSSYSRFRLN